MLENFGVLDADVCTGKLLCVRLQTFYYLQQRQQLDME